MAGKPREGSVNDKKEFDIDKALNEQRFRDFLTRQPNIAEIDENVEKSAKEKSAREFIGELHRLFLKSEKTTNEKAGFIESEEVRGVMKQLGIEGIEGIEHKLTDKTKATIQQHFEDMLRKPGGEVELDKISAEIKKYGKLKEQIAVAAVAFQAEQARLGGEEGMLRRMKLIGQAEKAGVNKFLSRRLHIGRDDQAKSVLDQLAEEGIEISNIGSQKVAIDKAVFSLAKLEKQKADLNIARMALMEASGVGKIINEWIQIIIKEHLNNLLAGSVAENVYKAHDVLKSLVKVRNVGSEYLKKPGKSEQRMAEDDEAGGDYLAEAQKAGITEASIEVNMANVVNQEIETVLTGLPQENGALSALESGLKEILKKGKADSTAMKDRVLKILDKKRNVFLQSDPAKAFLLTRFKAKLLDSMF